MSSTAALATGSGDRPATPIGRVPGRDGAATASIVRATTELLAEVGYGGLTTDLIAERAGVSKATMYRRWRTKVDLVVAAVESWLEPVVVPDLGSFRAEIEHVLAIRLEEYRRPGAARLLGGVIGAAYQDPALASALSDWLGRSPAMRTIADRASHRGELRPEIELGALATMLGAPLVFRLVVEQRPPDGAFVAQVVELVCGGALQRTPGDPR